MDAVLGSKSLPPGFRFHPTDEELVMFYLKRKVTGKSLGPQVMAEVDVSQFAPWELPSKASACLKSKDLNWYFMCPRSKRYPSAGKSNNRATVHGYWKSTGTDRIVNYRNRQVGKIKTLIFYRGKAPKGDRTNWVMHEYSLQDSQLVAKGVPQDSYMICKIYEKSGPGPKNGENYGAPFVEEEWDNVGPDYGPDLPGNIGDDQDGCVISDTLVCQESRDHVGPSLPSAVQQPLVPVPPMEGNEDEIDRVAAALNEGDDDHDGCVISNTLVGRESQDHMGPSMPCAVQQPLAVPPMEGEEDEIDRLLAAFTEGDDDAQILENEVFNGLEDLGGGTSTRGMEYDWSQVLNDDYFLELEDVQN